MQVSIDLPSPTLPNVFYNSIKENLIYRLCGVGTVCGIFGFYDFGVRRPRAAVIELLLTGLGRLEYRGYDSAGFALDSIRYEIDANDVNGKPIEKNVASMPSTDDLLLVKSSGKIADLRAMATAKLAAENIDMVSEFDIHVGIAHTRWATHGPPSTENSHPHSSGAPDHEFVVVHNGIITNFSVLKNFLQHHGEVFESDTDTEVIPKLCKYIYHSRQESVPFNQVRTTPRTLPSPL